jgi:hypothetical protein
MSPEPVWLRGGPDSRHGSKRPASDSGRGVEIGLGVVFAPAAACFVYMVAHTRPAADPRVVTALPPLVEAMQPPGAGAEESGVPLESALALLRPEAAPERAPDVVSPWAQPETIPLPPKREPERDTASAPLPPPRPADLARPAPGPASREAFIAAAGYDRLTAIYDIVAHTVTLPDGTRLEAHSGLGDRLDDPRYVSERDRGATPPHLYDLEPREGSFHGVRALRLTPVGDGDIFGRVGLLAHPYMLGPRGDSNGCVSVRDYDAFLRAYQNGQVRRLAVVARLPDAEIAVARK